MQFQKSRTFTNLARAFAGECQAGMRYQLAAKLAVAEEYPVLADTRLSRRIIWLPVVYSGVMT